MEHLDRWLWWMLAAALLTTCYTPFPSFIPEARCPSSLTVIPPELSRFSQLNECVSRGVYKPASSSLRPLCGTRRPVNGSAVHRAPPDLILEFRLETEIRHLQMFEDRVNNMYRRNNPTYHQWYQPGEFSRLHELSAGEKRRLVRELHRHNITTLGGIGRMLRVEGSVRAIDSLFHTDMHVYSGGVVAVRFDAQVPSHLPLIAIHRLGTLPRRKGSHAEPWGGYGNPSYADYSFMRMMYNVPESLTGQGQTVAIVGEGAVLRSDIESFEGQFMTGSDVDASVTCVPVSAFGFTCNSNPYEETTLDVSAVITMAPAANIVIYGCGGDSLDCFTQMADDGGMDVVTTSFYGDDDDGALNSILQQLMAQGVTVVSSSGDSGCASVFNPSDQPLLTVVGGSYMGANWQYDGGVSYSNWPGESPWPQSGGGQTDMPIPSWQVQAAQGNSECSTSYRMVPDLSMEAATRYSPQWGYVLDGVNIVRSGTSLSAPLFAGVVAAMNENQQSLGLSNVGMLNPVLYDIYYSTYYNWAFRDFSDGSTVAESGCSYTVVQGYDAVTGIGAPNVTNLLNAVAIFTSPGCGTPQPPTVSYAAMPLTTNFLETQTGLFSVSWLSTAVFLPQGARGTAATNASQVFAPRAALLLGRSYTMMCWALVLANFYNYPTLLMSSGSMGNPDSFWLQITGNTNNQLSFGHGTNSALNQAAHSAGSSLFGVWFHVAATYDASSLQAALYLNGQQVVSHGAVYLSSWQGGAPMMLGGGMNGVNYPIAGSMQCAMWYASALSSDEVGTLYSSQTSGGCGG